MSARSSTTSMDSSRLSYLNAIGIQVWLPRDTVVAAGADSWQCLSEEAQACTRCALSTSRRQVVFGTGDRNSDWLIVGEAPGVEEDRSGEPFVGPAGQLLNAMLSAIALQRDQVYIANVLKCRPPGNRGPLPEEVTACHDLLQRQIALLRPRMILAVGRFAAQALLASDQSIGALRGRCWSAAHSGIPVVVTYHPAYLLRKPTEKAKAWQDLCLAMATYRGLSDSPDTQQ